MLEKCDERQVQKEKKRREKANRQNDIKEIEWGKEIIDGGAQGAV